MKIGIEAERANNPVKTGVEHYAKQLILQFAEIDKEDEFVLYLRTEPEEWIKNLPKNFSYKVMPFPIFWTQARISWEMLRRKPDVLFIPASSMPLIHPRKTVVTVHDLAFMYYPETYTLFQRFIHIFEDVLVSKLAWKIITVSEATKKDFIKFWRVDEKRISVIHHGYTLQKFQISNDKFQINDKIQNPKSEIQPTNLQLSDKYILFLSTLQPRKNLPGLIEAFKKLKARHPELPHKLVVAGKAGWKSEESLKAIEANKDFVVYFGHVGDAQREKVYRHASAFCVPSFYEGFGMWILEAFDAGVPVLASNISSMPEVGGEACEYFDPKNSESICTALENVLLNEKRATELVALGRERLKDFSWRKCAEETLGVLKQEL